jgi:hypothetical protein
MLGVVGVFALLLSYFLVIGGYDITTEDTDNAPDSDLVAGGPCL